MTETERRQAADLSILIVNWNTAPLLRACLTAAQAETRRARLSAEIIVVDNASRDGSAEIVRSEFPHVTLLALDSNVGFARANTLGWHLCRGQAVLLLNPDTELQPGSLRALLDALNADAKVGAACGRFLNPDGSFQRYYNRFPTLAASIVKRTVLRRWSARLRCARQYDMLDADFSRPMLIEQPPAACLMLRRRVVEQVGMMDEQFPIFYNDVDLARRIHDAGYVIRYVPEARIVHHKGASFTRAGAWDVELCLSCVRYFKKHHSPAAAAVLRVLFAAHFGVAAVWSFLRNVRRGRAAACTDRARCLRDFLRGRLLLERT